jgi:hypothetical protein
MEKHDEQEITNLLDTIRAKRDLGSFVNGNVKNNGKAINPKPKPVISEEPTQLKTVEKGDNREKTDLSRDNRESGSVAKSKSSKSEHSPLMRSEMETELDQFLHKVRDAEATDEYTFSQFKRYVVDDDIFHTLLSLKNAGRLTNLSVLINTIVADFLEANRSDIELFLQSSKKKRQIQ